MPRFRTFGDELQRIVDCECIRFFSFAYRRAADFLWVCSVWINMAARGPNMPSTGRTEAIGRKGDDLKGPRAIDIDQPKENWCLLSSGRGASAFAYANWPVGCPFWSASRFNERAIDGVSRVVLSKLFAHISTAVGSFFSKNKVFPLENFGARVATNQHPRRQIFEGEKVNLCPAWNLSRGISRTCRISWMISEAK